MILTKDDVGLANVDNTSDADKPVSDAQQAALDLKADISSIPSIAGQINAATAKTTPVDADQLALTDSAASGELKKLSWANVKATLKSYFDTLYLTLTAGDARYVQESTRDAAGGFQARMDVVIQTASSRTLTISDRSKFIRCFNDSFSSITIPRYTFKTDDEIYFQQSGDAQITFTGGGGNVSLQKAAEFNAKSKGKFSIIGVRFISESDALLFGDLEPVVAGPTATELNADHAKLAGIEAGATGDMTPTEILAAVESESGVDLSSLPVLSATSNAAKLALTGVADNQEVRITGEGNRLERYLGDGQGFRTAVSLPVDYSWNSGNYTIAADTPFVRDSGGTWKVAGTTVTISYDGTKYVLDGDAADDDYESNPVGPTQSPADATTWTRVTDAGNGNPATLPAFEKRPVATEDNWRVSEALEATDAEITTGTETEPRQTSPAQLKLAAETHAVNRTEAQTISGQKTHTADIRILNDPDHGDAVLPRRMMDSRYRNPNMSMKAIDIWDDFVCDGTSTGIGSLPWKVAASSARVGLPTKTGGNALGVAELATSAAQGNIARAGMYYSTTSSKNQMCPRVAGAEYLWRFAADTTAASLALGFNFYDSAGAAIAEGTKRSWGLYSAPVSATWAASTAYALGDFVKPTSANGLRYKCTAAGTSSGSEPTWPTAAAGDTVTDGGVTWELDSLEGHANYQLVSGKSGLTAPTYLGFKTYDSGIPVTTDEWHTLRMRVLTTSSVSMWVDGGTPVTVELDIIQALEAGPSMVIRTDTASVAKLSVRDPPW